MLDITILLENLRELASEELQRKLWVHGNESQVSSFTEAICGIFDDARLTRALDTGCLENNFLVEICQKVVKLDKLIDQIPEDFEDLPPEKIIKHSKMNAMRALSDELLVLFEGEIVKGDEG